MSGYCSLTFGHLAYNIKTQYVTSQQHGLTKSGDLRKVRNQVLKQYARFVFFEIVSVKTYRFVFELLFLSAYLLPTCIQQPFALSVLSILHLNRLYVDRKTNDKQTFSLHEKMNKLTFSFVAGNCECELRMPCPMSLFLRSRFTSQQCRETGRPERL